jgi:protein-arginine kinase activator protein McsA
MGPGTRAAERELDQLEEQLERAIADGDEAEAKVIREDIREINRELSEQSRWEEEGEGRGWL